MKNSDANDPLKKDDFKERESVSSENEPIEKKQTEKESSSDSEPSVPEEAPNQPVPGASPETPEETPPGSSKKTPPETPEETPPGSLEETPPKIPEETPPGSSKKTPPESPEEIPPKDPPDDPKISIPPGSAEQSASSPTGIEAKTREGQEEPSDRSEETRDSGDGKDQGNSKDPGDHEEPESHEGPGDHGNETRQKRPRKKTTIKLIDDEEERVKNSSYDELDQDEQHQEQEEEEERLNFGLLSKEDLVKLLQEKLDNPARGNIRKDVEEIRQAFNDKVNSEREEKKQHFLEEGGDLEDFKPMEDPSEQEMKELLGKYRELKAEFTRQLEKTKQDNLEKKQEILEQFRILMEGQESFEVTFRKFKDLQKQWFSAGIVPQQHLKDLWDSYNYFVDKFNDYVRINRELRALDLKKNLELKTQLCERTEKLQEESNIVQAFKTLQKMHARWREIGPVPREQREELWERFKVATAVINKKHQEYHTRLKESLHENLKKKIELCEVVEGIAAVKYESHGAWAEKTRQVLDIQKTWKTVGYAPKKDNNAIYSRFRRACDVFFNNKASFYSAAFEEQKENLKLKQEITQKAEELSKSEDWKQTTQELIRLQKRWKEIGPVPRRDSDKIWRRFRRACDTFFDRKQKFFKDADSNFEVNLKLKKELIDKMNQYQSKGNRDQDVGALEDFQSRFSEIGFVPSSKKDSIKKEFRDALESLLQRIGMNESERSIFKFRNRVDGIIHSPRSDMKLNFERDKLVNKLQQLKNDIGLWENNIGFFKQSDSSEETIQGFHQKIEDARERIRVLEEKIRILDDMESAN